jgi:hypothetical protein
MNAVVTVLRLLVKLGITPYSRFCVGLGDDDKNNCDKD